MRCFECGGEVTKTEGLVKMTNKDGGLVIFKDVPLSQCRQCGEQYVSGAWAEKIGELMRREDTLVPKEVVSVPVFTFS